MKKALRPERFLAGCETADLGQVGRYDTQGRLWPCHLLTETFGGSLP